MNRPNGKSGARLGAAIVLCAGLTAGAVTWSGTDALPLYVAPSSHDFRANPKLLDRIRASPHGYFRFINKEFSEEVCKRFGPLLQGAPSTNLHGDAHIEQYAVTELGRGLTDFDDSSSGPIVLDLMRFAVSLRLACRAHGWEQSSEALYGELLRGYREALAKPDLEAPEPSLVTRVRTGFKQPGSDYFAWVTSLMEPIPEADRGEVGKDMQPYVDAMLADHPELGKDYFKIERLGALKMGIGSALDMKYLVEVRGPTDDPLDNVVLELKQVRDLSHISCVTAAANFDPFRILLGQARISYTPFRLLGYVRIHEVNFWIHAWVRNYKEIDIADFETPEQLSQVVYDVGVQLGRGHPKQVADPFGWQLRRELSQLLDRLEPALQREARDLEAQTISAWQRFSAETQAGGSP
jgi:uncharacterized protein DUF2252